MLPLRGRCRLAWNRFCRWVRGGSRPTTQSTPIAGTAMSDGTYPWYATPSGREITQGDILFDCPIPVPVSVATATAADQGSQMEVEIKKYDVVVMTQACDIEQGKVDDIILCPLSKLDDIAPASNIKPREELRKGNVVGRHLLNEARDFEFHVVEFRQVFSLPKEFLLEFAGKASRRVRLLPPYREHLAQAFARFFMRVGLPLDIPRFDGARKR